MNDESVGARTVVVVAKEPVPGRVKTRLCPPCTPEQAAGLARAALADTLDAVVAAQADRRVLVLDGQVGPWVPDGVAVVPQRGDAFAERLDAAWLDSAGDRPGPTLQIGMDTPQVTAALLDDALDRLAAAPAVIGLADDGGWWALGLHGHLPGAFESVPMSEPDTGTRQEARIEAVLGTAPRRLSFLRDVDHITDARAVAAVAPDTRFARYLEALTL